MFTKVWLLTIFLTGCIGGAGNSPIELSGFDTSISGSSTTTKSANVTSADIVNNQLVLGGTNLDTVTNVRVTGPSSFDETFAIESQSENSLIANGLNNIAFGIAGIFSLIITDAKGASSYTITFTVADDSITGAMISDMSASNGDALTFNSGTGEWEPTPLSGLNLVGTWNANTDSPDLADGGTNTSPSHGDFYVVGTTGTTNIDGTTTWNAGDWILFNGTTWERVANSSGVISFNGRMGVITPTANDYTWAQIDKTTSPINDLSDINTSGAVSGSILKFDGTNWIVGTDNDTGGNVVNNSTSTILNADNDGDGSGDIDFQINSSTVASIKNNGDFVVGTNTFVVDDSTSSIGVGVLAPSYDFSFSGNSDKAIGMERHTTSNTAGSDLFLYTGGATSGATDKDGGDLYIASGTATGSGNSHIYFQTATAGSSGTADNSPNTKMTILGSGNVGIGTTSPVSKLQVSGYIQLDTVSGAPPSGDCDSTNEYGRMKIDPSTGINKLYICTTDGWQNYSPSSGGASSSNKSLVSAGGAIRWSDGTYSRSCLAYRQDSSYENIGGGDTDYWINPNNDDNTIVKVTCSSMTTGTAVDATMLVSSSTTGESPLSFIDLYDSYLSDGEKLLLTGDGFNVQPVEKCAGSSPSVYSDACSGGNATSTANLAIALGDRGDLSAPANSSRLNITKNVGPQANDGGGDEYDEDENGTTDNKWYEWVYATSGNIINNMIDYNIPFQVNYHGYEYSNSSSSTYNYTNVDIGTPTITRMVVLAVTQAGDGSGTTLTSATIAGITGTHVTDYYYGSTRTYLVTAVVTGGTTANIDIVWSSSVARSNIVVYSVDGYDSTTPHDTDTGRTNHTLDIPNGGTAISFGYHPDGGGSNGTFTSGYTTIHLNNSNSEHQLDAAIYNATSDLTNHSIIRNNGRNGVAGSWAPR